MTRQRQYCLGKLARGCNGNCPDYLECLKRCITSDMKHGD